MNVPDGFVRAWFEVLVAGFANARDELARLDRQVGDGDHGETMLRAFRAGRAALDGSDDDAGDVDGRPDGRPGGRPGDDLLAAGRALMEGAGGASGPLIASLFLSLGTAVRDRGVLDAHAFAAGLAEARELVQRMGRCAPGDKTLLDALAPAADAASRAADDGQDLEAAWHAAAEAARNGRDATARMEGRRGRAAWVEGRGIGTPDPGATSLALILALGRDVARNEAATDDGSNLNAPRDLSSVADAASGESRAANGVTPEPGAPPTTSSSSADARAHAPAGKLLNDPADAVDQMIDGFVRAYPERVRRLGTTTVVVRTTPKPHGRVGLVIGNGSGHEPIAMGWVGEGMLDANAVGPIFTAPGPDLVARAVAAADHGAGVLLLVSHHEGDRIAGEMAAAIARIEGHRVETLLMYDDIASAPKGREADRRGGPGTAFVYKIVGQALEEGLDLGAAKALGERIRGATRTLSVAVAPGTSPVSGEPMFGLPPGEAFLGMGVHGEPGFARMPTGSVDAICERVVNALIDDAELAAGEVVVPFVNGAGGTSLMELLVAARSVFDHLDVAGIRHVRPLIGSYVTTQETKGFSVSLLRLDDDDDLRRWSAPCDVPFFQL